MKRKNPLLENATKGDLLILKNDIETKLSDLEYRLDGNAQKYRDQILTSNDKLVKKLEEMRDENIIGSGQTSQLREQVEDHEKRIKNIEEIQQTT